MFRFLMVLVFLTLAGCQTDKAEEIPLAPVGTAKHFEQEKAMCEARGGSFGRGGKSAISICYERPKDAGTYCAQNSDCEGLCLAKSRTCAPVKPLFGCNEVLTAPGQVATLCID